MKIFASPDFPQRGWGGTVTDDGRYLLIYGSEGTDSRNRLYYVDLKDPLHPDLTGPVVKLIDVMEADYAVLGNRGSVLFVRTDLDAPKKKIVAIDLAQPDKANWKTLVPEAELGAIADRLSGVPIQSVALDGAEIVASGEVSLFALTLPLGLGLTPGAVDGQVAFTPSSIRIGDSTFDAAGLAAGAADAGHLALETRRLGAARTGRQQPPVRAGAGSARSALGCGL